MPQSSNYENGNGAGVPVVKTGGATGGAPCGSLTVNTALGLAASLLLLLEMRGSLLTRRVLAAADLLMPLLKLLAVALYLPVLVGAER
jgi:hypothetical protein